MALSSKWSKCANHENTKMIKMCKSQMMKINKKVLKNDQKWGGLISALKPGPVVPPGTQKVPNQAARISQSGDFGHLSDILAILGGTSFFDVFFTFSWFSFCAFSHFCIFWFLSLFVFLCFSTFYWFCVLLIFDLFYLFFVVNITFCHFLC